jgi:hypothetical protein
VCGFSAPSAEKPHTDKKEYRRAEVWARQKRKLERNRAKRDHSCGMILAVRKNRTIAAWWFDDSLLVL